MLDAPFKLPRGKAVQVHRPFKYEGRLVQVAARENRSRFQDGSSESTDGLERVQISGTVLLRRANVEF